MYKILSDGDGGQPGKTKNKNQAQNVCTYLTYLHGSHLTPNLGNFSPGRPSIPHPRWGWKGSRRKLQGFRQKVLRGTAYFYSWLKNISNFFKFRLPVARRAGPRGERGPCCAAVSLQRGTSLFPWAVCGSADPSRVAGNRIAARIKRNEK